MKNPIRQIILFYESFGYDLFYLAVLGPPLLCAILFLIAWAIGFR